MVVVPCSFYYKILRHRVALSVFLKKQKTKKWAMYGGVYQAITLRRPKKEPVKLYRSMR